MLLRASTCERLHHFSPVNHRPDITTVAGRPADRRAPPDRTGAGTVRAERYGPIVRAPEHRRARRERGLEEEALACIVSGRMALAPDIPLLASPQSRIAIITPAASSLPACPARVQYVRAERDGALDLGA